LKPWMDEVTRRTNGAVVFQHYPNQQLGKAADLLRLTQTGVVDIGYIAPSYVSDKMPVSEVAQLPVDVPPYEAVARAAQSAARNQRRRQSVRRSVPFLYTGLATAALAAGIVAMVWIGRARSAAPKLLAPGGEILATAEAKSAILGNGVRIRLDAGSLKLAMADKDAQTLILPLGRVFVDVPKLPTGSTLSVRTPDAEVRVHGTRFQVIRTGKDTQVHVVEGVVEVRPEGIGRPVQMLRAGESATVGAAEAYREGLRQSTLNALDHGEFASAEKQIGEMVGSSADRSQQAEAQALLAWSLSARGKRSEAAGLRITAKPCPLFLAALSWTNGHRRSHQRQARSGFRPGSSELPR